MRFGIIGGKRVVWLCLLVAGMALTGRASDLGEMAGGIARWGDTLSIDSRVTREIDRYAEEEGEAFATGYARRLARKIRRLIFADVTERLRAIADGDVEPFVEVAYPEAGFATGDNEPPDSEIERDFEDSFVRTELVAIFDAPGVAPSKALQLYTSPEFRKESTSRFERIWEEEGETCIETSGVAMLLAPMLNCSRIDEFFMPDLAVEHSQVVRNGGGEDYQPVYFKESIKMFIRTPDGLVLHYINYSRTMGMGGLKKKIGRGKIRGSQEEAVEEFRGVLKTAVPASEQDQPNRQ